MPVTLTLIEKNLQVVAPHPILITNTRRGLGEVRPLNTTLSGRGEEARGGKRRGGSRGRSALENPADRP